MIDYDIYSERRQQLIDCFEDCYIDLVDILDVDITTLVDILDWEDNEKLAEAMGWTGT
jgi:hypothetical protein